MLSCGIPSISMTVKGLRLAQQACCPGHVASCPPTPRPAGAVVIATGGRSSWCRIIMWIPHSPPAFEWESSTAHGLMIRGSISSATSAKGSADSKINTDSTSNSTETSALLTLYNVQLLQPRGRFDLIFSRAGVAVTGKAGTIFVSWKNVRHIMKLPRPEGYNWGKSLDPDDPAGSDLIALPLNEPVPFRKSKTSLVLLQPDPKAKRSELSIPLDGGVSHQVSGSQGTVIMSIMDLLCDVRQTIPDRGLFASRDGKSFIKCYHGVNEGALFPLKQGLLFMKPALFLPRSDIEEVVCGRGGSATTRYVDLVVGLKAFAVEGGAATVTQQEFSNIDRDALPSLQSYIRDALVAPRQREIKKAAKIEAAAAAQRQQDSNDNSGVSIATESPLVTSQATAEAVSGDTKGGSGAAFLATKAAASAKRSRKEDDDEEDDDDGDDESDEDFAPIPGDTDSDDDSGSDVGSDSDGGDDRNTGSSGGKDSDGDDGDGGDDGDDGDGDDLDEHGGGGREGVGPERSSAQRAEALKELDKLAEEAAGGGGIIGSRTGGSLDSPNDGGPRSGGTAEPRKKRKRSTRDVENAASADHNTYDDTESD